MKSDPTPRSAEESLAILDRSMKRMRATYGISIIILALMLASTLWILIPDFSGGTSVFASMTSTTK
jgi:hypothetical protein